MEREISIIDRRDRRQVGTLLADVEDDFETAEGRTVTLLTYGNFRTIAAEISISDHMVVCDERFFGIQSKRTASDVSYRLVLTRIDVT